MPSPNQILSVLAAIAVASANAAMGPAFSTGPVGSGSWIREATSTLVLPDVPQGSTGVASLWVGMGTDKGDLIQSIADNWQSDEWSIFAYTLTKTGDNAQLPVQDEHQTPAKKGDRVTMHYKYDASTQEYVQYVSINGKQVSTLSTSKGHEAMGFGSSVECGASDCGTIGAHQWVDTKIILDTADPNYIQTFGKGEGVTGGEMTTSDGGKTWPLRQLYPDPKSAPSHAPPARIEGKGETKHAFDTWRTPSGQKGRLWLQQDLPAHIPDSRIFLYQYDATPTYGRGLGDFRSKADNLLEVISNERGDDLGRPILLLGHNLGGLLIKQALINAHGNPGYIAIKDATAGLVFFGTPQDTVAQRLGETAVLIAKDLGLRAEDDVVKSLQTATIFSELGSWKHQVLEYDIVSFWGSSDTVVSRECASLGLPGDIAKIVELNASHRELCKFGTTDRDQYNLKIVVVNIKRLYKIAIEKFESQGVWFPDTSGVETPRTSEEYVQNDLNDGVEGTQSVTTSTTDTTRQPVLTPSQGSQLQADETTVQNSPIKDYGHPNAEEAPGLTGSAVGDLHIADIQEAQGNLYSRTLFTNLSLPEPVLQGVRYLNYQWPTKVQESVLSAFTSCPPRNVVASYPPGTGRTTALAIALLSRIDYRSTTQPQALVIVPTRLLVRQTENCIKEIGRSCDGLIIETITASSKPTAKLEANVIVATPGRLFDYIRRRLVDTSQVRFFLVDDVDYVVDFPALRQLCIRVARKSPKTTQFLLFSDLSTRASEFVNDMLRSNTWEKHEVKAVELNANKIVHLLFRCSGEQEKLDIICQLPGVVQISMLIIFVQMRSSAQQIHLVLANEGHAVTNLFNASDDSKMEGLLEEFKTGQTKVLITKDYKTRGLDLPSSSMVINYDIITKGYQDEPDLGLDRYIRQVSRAGKAGRSGFAVNLGSNEKEVQALQTIAASGNFKLHELGSNDWDEVEHFLRNCARSRRY
ncbi:hypothetical protein ACKAV7_005616 [Fusarium commune]